MKATICNQLYVRTANELGAGGRLFSSLVGLGVNVIAFNGWEAQGEAHFRIILEDPVERPRAALIEAGFAVETNTAIAVEMKNQPGALVALLRTLSEADIDVANSYATTASAENVRVVLETSDNDFARHIISTIPGRA
jgi:hypothetical protein